MNSNSQNLLLAHFLISPILDPKFPLMPTSAGGHGYIIVVVDYFTKWAEAMPTYVEDGKIATLFMFNHIIARFGVPQSIVMIMDPIFVIK